MRPFFVAAFVVFADQITKAAALSRLKFGESVGLIGGAFHLTLVRNSGAAFGLFKEQAVFFILVSVLAVVFIAYFLYRRKSGPSLPLALILGGATGNLIDRVRFGYVVDFLDFKIWPVFNAADAAISIGVFLLFLSMIKGKRERR